MCTSIVAGLALVLACVLPAQAAHSDDDLRLSGENGSIGIYFDPLGTQCSGTIRPNQPGTIYVLAKRGGVTTSGIGGAEFRFNGIPDSWVVYPVANPDILTVGNPFGNGVTVALPFCSQSDNGVYVLYTVLVLATDEEADLEFTIEPRNPPSNRDFDCSMLLRCDPPDFTEVCVETVPCFVNSYAPKICDAGVPVSPQSWSGVKALYR